MKIYLPSRLYAALVAAVISISSYTLSSAHAAGVAESKEELATPTLTGLNTLNSSLYPTKSAYQLEEVTDLNLAEDISIIKYHFDASTGTYTPVQYNVVFDTPLGDEKPDDGEYTFFQWIQNEETKLWSLEETDDENLADIRAYSTKNERLEHLENKIDVDNSFIGLAYTSEEEVTTGGALTSEAEIGTITGDFIFNSVSGSGATVGGAINIVARVTNITGNFIANSAKGDEFVIGGAIANSGAITNIAGDFIANTAKSENPDSSHYEVYGGAIFNMGTITNITGDFISNSAASSGAVASSGDSYRAAGGGAILNNHTITNITGDFISNAALIVESASAETHCIAAGGAIYNQSDITSITGSFIRNSASVLAAEGSTTVLNNSNASGGAISNTNTIRSITGDFIANSAVVSNGKLDNVAGGAVMNVLGKIAFLALDRSMEFTGNFISADGGQTKTYEAIFNGGDESEPSTLHFNAYGDNSIVMNDGINGFADYEKYQIIDINNGSDGAGEAISADGKDFSTVEFNSFVNNQSITVHAGELRLGEFAGIGQKGETGYVPSTQAALNNSSVTVHAGAELSVEGQLVLDATSSISTSTEGTEDGVSTIKGLAADSSITGGSIIAAANSSAMIKDMTLTNISLNTDDNAILTLQDVTLGSGVTIDMGVRSNKALSLTNSTLVLSSDAPPTLTKTRNFNADEHSYYTLTSNVLISEISGSLTLDITLGDTSLSSIEGGLFGILLTDADGISASDISALKSVNIIINQQVYSQQVSGYQVHNGGLFILTQIPEPSTATLSLLALAGLLARRRRSVS